MDHMLYQSQRALSNLRKAPVTFSEQIDGEVSGGSAGWRYEIDHGDLLLVQSTLEGITAALGIIASYDVDVSVADVAERAARHALDVERDLLNPKPRLLRLQPQHIQDLLLARIALRRSLAYSLDASDYLRHSDDVNQQDDLFRLTGRLADVESRIRPEAERLLTTLVAHVNPNPDVPGDDFLVDLNPWFDVPKDIRDYLPRFNGLRPDTDTLADPTLGGLLPDFTYEEWR
jgi:hypothetical protein